jgi:hypothetical protein
MLIILAIAGALSAQEDATPDCPGCDMRLRGWTIGGFFGGGTISVDADSPQVSEAMNIDALPEWSYRAGGGIFFYPGGRYRVGIFGGYNWAGVGDDDKYIETNAIWGTVLPEFVRTTNALHISGGLGLGGGVATIFGSATGKSGEEKEQIAMFVMLPRFGIELPIIDVGVLSVDFSYQWFFGEDRTVEWSDGAESVHKLHFSPIEIGGPVISVGLQIGSLRKSR